MQGALVQGALQEVQNTMGHGAKVSEKGVVVQRNQCKMAQYKGLGARGHITSHSV